MQFAMIALDNNNFALFDNWILKFNFFEQQARTYTSSAAFLLFVFDYLLKINLTMKNPFTAKEYPLTSSVRLSLPSTTAADLCQQQQQPVCIIDQFVEQTLQFSLVVVHF